MDEMLTWYKVVRVTEDGRRVSFTNVPKELLVEYALNEKVEGKVGPLFLFPDLRSARMFLRKYAPYHLQYYEILECAINPSDVVERKPSEIIDLSGPRYGVSMEGFVQEVERFWKPLKEGGYSVKYPRVANTYAPPFFTVLAWACTPTRVMEK